MTISVSSETEEAQKVFRYLRMAKKRIVLHLYFEHLTKKWKAKRTNQIDAAEKTGALFRRINLPKLTA
jgi:hypothetical protein